MLFFNMWGGWGAKKCFADLHLYSSLHWYIDLDFIWVFGHYVQNVQYTQDVDSSPVDILRGASVEGSSWPWKPSILGKTSLRFYFVSNVNKLKSVLTQKIFDPTSIVLINIKHVNQTFWHINITTFEQL